LTTKASSSVNPFTILLRRGEIPAVFRGLWQTISDNLQVVENASPAPRGPPGPQTPFCDIVAVSKGHRWARIEEARAAGHQAFGENYVQEAAREDGRALPGSNGT